MKQFKLVLALLFLFSTANPALATATLKNDELADLVTHYKHLHQNPELSKKEHKTGEYIAKELAQLGFTVTPGLAGTGVVALYANGDGQTLMLRADMDALPVEEQTGLPYASQIPVMHACGHDVHMTVVLGTAKQLIANKHAWQGQLLLVFQPAEEIGYGAKAMLNDGLFEKFPQPDFNLTMHVAADLLAGKIGYVKGYAMANVDSVDISVFGLGGHGAYPHKTKDPVVLAAQIITHLQTIVSREISPLDSAVITVGSIHGGTKHNIIGNEVKLQLTVRSYSDETREYLLSRIKEVSEGLARTSGLPETLLPKVVVKNENTPSVYNEPEYTQKLVNQLTRALGEEQVVIVDPVMAGEDFARYGRTKAKIPSALFWLGAVEPTRYQQAKNTGQALPSLHSAKFAPDAEKTIVTGVKGMTTMALSLLAK